jgi:hypothetical protein
MTDKGVYECTRTRRIPGGGAGVEAEVSVGDGASSTEYGRGMLMTFRTANCAEYVLGLRVDGGEEDREG